ncbi:EAL domain-containing protein [Petroclostridium sp. X23]|uniref:EAL domain-containing protein n=1 Tax=Petroclostridium sp. X23 TaxID=3045146 RepID=UPI0024ACAF5C|nr:EAL domain-containing protein [Petroclostridium sp. X23]WHH60362.1 EAL domain-containing protein [Petroclostridium sp. X23]
METKRFRINMIQKVFIYLFAACILPILSYGLFAYHKTNAVIHDQISKATYGLMENQQKNLELIMQNIQSLIISISSLDEIRNVLVSEYSDSAYNKLIAQTKIGYILSGYSNLKGVVSIDLFSMDGIHYHVGETLDYKNIRTDLKERLIDEALTSNKTVVWNGIEDNMNLNSSYKKVITASKAIKTVDAITMKEKVIGVIIVNYDVDAFTENIGGSTLPEGVYLVIDDKNRIVYHPDKNMVGKEVNPAFIEKVNKISDSFIDSINGEKMIVTHIKSDKSGWKTVVLIPYSGIRAKTAAISNNMILLVTVCFLMLISFVVWISKKYLSPVKRITELFKQFQEGNIDLNNQLDSDSNDEIGELIIWFNAFLQSMKEKKSMEEEIVKREKLLKGIADATNILLETTKYDMAFNEALKILGEITGVDRVYIFQNYRRMDTGDLLMSQRFEWCREGIESQIDNEELHNLSYINAGLLQWYQILSSGKTVSGLVSSLPDAEQEGLRSQGILSILAVPIFIDNEFWGFIGFDDCSIGRIWSKIEEDTLRIAATSIGSAFKRIQAENALQEILKDDFKKTVQNLQNLVFKLEKNDKGDAVFTLFEGKIAAEVRLNTSAVFGKTSEEIFYNETAYYFNTNIAKAFEGKVSSFDVKLGARIFYTTLSPIMENDIVNEVVGSAIDITEQRRAEEKIRYMAYYDDLTGLPNRIFFNECLSNALKSAENNTHRNMMAVLFLDLDQFKLINDTLGHDAGDVLLKKAAERLNKTVSDEAIISRMGGDEFTILLSEVSCEQDVVTFAQKVLEIFTHSFVIDQNEFFITTSIGISIYPQDGQDMESLLKNADIAMYRAKEKGRNSFHFYAPNIDVFSMKRLNMEKNLRMAVNQHEFLLNYQPRLDVKTGNVLGCEALIRWEHPVLGMIPPSDFIPLAEETGLIVPIGEWVLRTACLQNKRWHDTGYAQLKVSVNISAKQFQYENIVQSISDILKETELSPEYLELEITENCIMQNTDRTISIIDDLKAIGVKISIDDFGTGFSSMSYLRRFAVDSLKIDKAFIDHISSNSSDAAIASAIINMAHSLRLEVVAEGVETEEQHQLLKSFGCDEIQGFLYSRPLSTENFTHYLQNSRSIMTR